MSDTPPEKELLEELEVFVALAAAHAKEVWVKAHKANENASQKVEIYRELMSMTSAAMDSLDRALRVAQKKLNEMNEKLAKKVQQEAADGP